MNFGRTKCGLINSQFIKTGDCSLTRLSVLLASVGLIASISAAHAAVKTVVLVHGAFADGSGWKSVSDILMKDGYTVAVVEEPENDFRSRHQRHKAHSRQSWSLRACWPQLRRHE